VADTYTKPLGQVQVADVNGEGITSTTVGAKQSLDVNITGGDIIIDNPTIVVDINAFGATPDSILAVGSEDGTETGIRHVVKVDADGAQFVAQEGVWNTGRTWALDSTTDSVGVTQGTVPWAVSGPLTDAELRASAVPVSALSLPLPAGAATAANQATEIASLASIDAKLTAPLSVTGPITDAQLRAADVDVNITNATLAVTQSTSPWVVAATDLDTRNLVFATDKVDVSGSTLGANSGVDIGDVTINNAAGAAAVNIQDGGNSITVDGPLTDTELRATPVPISGTVTANAGTNLNTSALALETTQVANGVLIGAVTETAPGIDTASSGLNGRLQRIAQRLTSLISLLPASLGQKTMANSLAVTLASDQSPASMNDQSIGAHNSAVPGFVTMLGADDGVNSQRLQGRISSPLDTDYGLVVRNIPRERLTYAAATPSVVPAASATDIFTITGSGTKTVYIHKITVTGTRTAHAHDLVQLIKRSTANSGGTSATLTNVPYDSTNAAATAVVRSYTANPTLGTAVGTVYARRQSFPVQTPANAQGNGGSVVPWEWTFVANAQPIILRGTNQVLAVNLNAITITGGILQFSIEWSEE
jgi:hypothetical protein